MYKKCSFILLLVGFSLAVWANERSASDAATLAAMFMQQQADHHVMARKGNGDQLSALPQVDLVYKGVKSDQQAAFYVFNNVDRSGSVIVSADDRTEPILGYMDEGTFDYATANPSLKWWLDRYAKHLSALTEDNRASDSPATTAIFPLLGATKWDQGAPYCNRCPKDLITGYTSMTGCVATAAAQIMYKWQYPVHGSGTHSYRYCRTQYDPYQERCEELGLKFDTIIFDWDNIRPSYKSSYSDVQGQAVATLMYCCGVACNMNYSSDGSGSFTDDMGYGLTTYMGYTYTKFVSAASRREYLSAKGEEGILLNKTVFDCTTSELGNYLNEELEAGRPVLMGGYDMYSGGHEFVCDGRNTAGKFHINWGWAGDENGYFTLDVLGKSFDFSTAVDMLLGLEPKEKPSGMDECVSSKEGVSKWMYNGQLYIQYNGVVYNSKGQRIN